ncbi:MAG: hypothetical protein U9Q34_04195 [Elusimicrobiota bacterium]|nr:hypothetical protein [Elusimicrobiota bacterium]
MKRIYKLYDRFILPAFSALFFVRAGGSINYVLKKRAGQNTVEFLLMLSVIVGMILIGGILFHKKILGGFFTIVGMIVGGGSPS